MKEPRFDRDYEYGRQGELLLDDWIETLKNGQARVESKRKSWRDCFLYIEYEHDPGRQGRYHPSGITTSESELWSFVIADTGILILVPANRIKRAIAAGLGRPVEEQDGSCPTRGRLIHLDALLQEACDPE